MGMIVRLIANAAGVWLAVQLLGGLDFTGDWIALLLIALILGVVNALVRPLAKLLSLPLLILTLGLFILVVNAAMLSLTVWLSGKWDLGLTSDGFGSTFLGAIIISLVSWAITSIFGPDDDD